MVAGHQPNLLGRPHSRGTLPDQGEAADVRTVFLVEDDRSCVTATVRQDRTTALLGGSIWVIGVVFVVES